MNQNEENLVDFPLPFLTHPQAESRGQIQFCQNLIVNLFEKSESPCTTKFPDVKIKISLLDKYLQGLCNLTSQYGIYRIEISSPNNFHDKYLIQTDDVDIELSKVFTEYIKNIQRQN